MAQGPRTRKRLPVAHAHAPSGGATSFADLTSFMLSCVIGTWSSEDDVDAIAAACVLAASVQINVILSQKVRLAKKSVKQLAYAVLIERVKCCNCPLVALQRSAPDQQV